MKITNIIQTTAKPKVKIQILKSKSQRFWTLVDNKIISRTTTTTFDSQTAKNYL